MIATKTIGLYLIPIGVLVYVLYYISKLYVIKKVYLQCLVEIKKHGMLPENKIIQLALCDREYGDDLLSNANLSMFVDLIDANKDQAYERFGKNKVVAVQIFKHLKNGWKYLFFGGVVLFLFPHILS